MQKRKAVGRGLFLSRDSGGKHENTPAQYIDWARRQADLLGVKFGGTGEQIERMTRTGMAVEGDVFWDYGVSGEKLSRKGLDAFLKEALTDLDVSHVFIPRRDRFARPEDPFDAVKLENTLRHAGITVVFMDRTCAPIIRGQKRDIGDMITSLLDYNYSGEYVQELAQKMVYAQIQLAKRGFSTGGRAPYGFRRHLVNENGTIIRQLVDGEYVKMAGHHVVWLPGPDEEIAVILRIIELIDRMPASRVAALLTADGVPTPDAERTRTDGGVRHKTSGVWHQPTVVNIARNPLNKALVVYGKRSMGRLQRYTPEGPRPLEDGEFLVGDKKKVVRNSDTQLISAPASFKPLVDPAQHDKLQAKLDARAGTQKGKPRSWKPDQNPLGGRVFDMACSWPMYRTPTSAGFCYKCGLYQQSHGMSCAHNWIDGQQATRFVLNATRQRMSKPGVKDRVRQCLLRMAQAESASAPDENLASAKQAARLTELDSKLKRVANNMALADNDEQQRAMKVVFEELRTEHAKLLSEIRAMKKNTAANHDSEAEVEAAMQAFETLDELVRDASNLAAIGECIKQLNVKLFLRFAPERNGKRTLNKLVGGVMTTGMEPPPITPYEGLTCRRNLKELAAETAKKTAALTGSAAENSNEVDSLGNVHRGERI